MFENVIADLIGINGVKSIFIVDKDGNLIESESKIASDKNQSELSAALISELFNKCEDFLSKLSLDTLEFMIAEGKTDRIFVSSAGNDLILGIIADHSANFGLLKLEAKKAVEKISAMV